MTTVEHATFTLERTYPATRGRVWDAWATLESKLQWFGNPDKVGTDVDGGHVLDFRVGGHETFADRTPNGATFAYDATFYDIVEQERIVASYEMHMDGRRISVSVYTVELSDAADGTTLVLTEQGAFLDGLDTNAQREEGTAQLLDALGGALS